jgi:ABC-2 type transport system permease protein
MRGALRRVWAIAHKETRQLRRDRLTFGMIIGIPTLQLLLFGYAINLDVRGLTAVVADQAATQRSRELVADAEASQVIRVVAEVASVEELEATVRRGRASVGLLVPADFERRIQDGRPAAQLLVDGSDPVMLTAASGLLDLPVPGQPRMSGKRSVPGQASVAGLGAAERAPTFALRPLYNPEARAAVQIVPGLVGVILTMTMTLFTAVAIVRERERGNLELLITTPVRTPELMLGKILPYVAIGLVQAALVLLLGTLLFRVPLRGGLLDLFLTVLLFISAVLSMGLLISTVAKSQFQSFQITIFFFLPQILLSGFMFPFVAMPRAARWIAELFPLTHFVRLIRGILLRGAALAELTVDVWPLVAFLALTLGLAIARFRKRLD